MRRPAAALLLAAIWVLSACTLTTSETLSTAAPSPTSAAVSAAPVTAAWVDGGDLFTWRSGDTLPRRIASGGAILPFVSPDGAWAAYLRGPDGDPRSLWISDTPGATERQLIDTAALFPGEVRRLSQVVWAADSSGIYFNTLVGDGIDTVPADDLWFIDAPAGTAERLLPDGQGGTMYPAPDGTRLALASAGVYGQPGQPDATPGQIVFYDPGTRQRALALAFDAVATGSERRWYPELRWMADGSGVYAAIPPADLIYGAPGQLTALWWLPVSGDAARIGQAAADFFGLPVFSADGQWIAYVQARAAPDQTTLTLMLARCDGSDPVIYAEGDIMTLRRPEWLPAGDRFTFMQGPDTLWIGQPGAAPGRFPAEDVAVSQIVWVGASTYVLASPADGAFTLGFGALDAPLQTIATTAAYPFFDAVMP